MFPNRRKNSSVTLRRNLITYSNPDSLIAEQFRTLRTNVQFLMGKGENRILLITSPTRGEGKSNTAANIAVSMAQQNEKVLIIDANLREPALHYIFKISNSTGLTDVLTERTTFEEAVNRTEIGRLEVLTSGLIPYNPTELLGSNKLENLFQKVKNIYDFIIVDSAGVLEVADTKVLANKCDGVILVVNESSTHSVDAIETKKALEFAKARLIGLVVNEV